MHIKKSLVAAVAAAGLGGSALALVAPGAAQAAIPAGADVAGTVTVNGAPVANAEVYLYDASKPEFSQGTATSGFIGTAYTDASGQYWFDFNADTDGDGIPDGDASDGIASTGNTRQGSVDDTAPTATQFKAEYFDSRDSVRGQLDWQYQYTGNQPTYKRAVPVNRVLGGLTTMPTIGLPVLSGIQGAVTVPVPAGYYYYGAVTAYDSDDFAVDTAYFDSDPTNDATDPLDGGTSYEFRDLAPGTYHLRFSAYADPIDPNSPADEITYISTFYGDVSNLADATSVDTISGQFLPGINGSLTNVLQAKVKPSIDGVVAPGKKVTADPGTWSRTGQTTYTYQWLLNGTLVSTSDSYKLPKKKTLNKKLQLVVTAQYFDYSGTVALAPVKVKYASKFKGKAKPVYVKGKRVVQVTGTVKPQGVKNKKKLAKALKGAKVTVYEISKTDDTVMTKVGKAKVKGGKVTVTVKGLISGKHELEIVLTGKKLAEVIKTVTVKV